MNLEKQPETSNKTKKTAPEVPEKFQKLVKEFLNDILTTFPELKENLDSNLKKVLQDSADKETIKKLFEFAKEIYPERFFDILYQNEDIFNNDEINTTFLPNINFSFLMNDDISEKTKEIIWKYLQLVLFCVIENVEESKTFGETATLFEAMDENVLKEKLEETMKGMADLFGNENDDLNFDEMSEDLPNPEDIHEHINGLLNGNLGKLATQITEETLKDLDIDLNVDGDASVSDVFKSLFKNPGKLINMIKKVGKSLDQKLKSGEIKESELMEEASDFLKKMNKMPGMKNMASMFKDMGVPVGKNGKMNFGAMQGNLQKNIRMSKMKERMRRKLEKRNSNKDSQIRILEKQLEEAKIENKKLLGETTKKSNKKKKRRRKKNKNKK
tara:strand:+ start:10350 stop:11507 length:1158 start_codon:yes stop_codon:yes gene_type:complete